MDNTETWQELTSQDQRNLFNAACGDLANQVLWHGKRLSKDDYRHMISGTVLGWRMFPAIDMGDGNGGFIMLGGSSLDLKKPQTTLAIQISFAIGDAPEAQGLNVKPVRWCQSVCCARWIKA